MTDWIGGYRAAIADVAILAAKRGISSMPLIALLADMQQDALVLAAARKALPLFAAEPGA